MPRRRKAKPVWMTLPVWTAAGLLIAWGIWQAAQFRKSLVADGASLPIAEPMSTPASTEKTETRGEPVAEAPERDAWEEAMLPAGTDEAANTQAAGGTVTPT